MSVDNDKNISTAFSDKKIVDALLTEIKRESEGRQYNIMEVCGTHTMALSRTGLRSILPKSINLLSGPGCPVCVTAQGEIDLIFDLIDQGVSIISFGDLLKIPSSSGRTLLKARSTGADIRVIYSPLDSIAIAKKELDKKFVFIGVGFETTAPTIAYLVKLASEQKMKNLSVLSFCKTMPEAIALLLSDDIAINGFLCPGHVTIVTGYELYTPMIEKNKAAVIAGFEPVEILEATLEIVRQVNSNQFKIVNKYKRVVSGEKNHKAYEVMNDVYTPITLSWRGLGELKNSGLGINEKYKEYDALKIYDLKPKHIADIKGCKCGSVLTGKITPKGCPLFGKACTTETPIGPCMVSSEGTCAAYYKYDIK